MVWWREDKGREVAGSSFLTSSDPIAVWLIGDSLSDPEDVSEGG